MASKGCRSFAVSREGADLAELSYFKQFGLDGKEHLPFQAEIAPVRLYEMTEIASKGRANALARP